jgi:hypothetical protein
MTDPATAATRLWIERIKVAELEDAMLYGIVLPGDSSLAIVLNAMEEAAYAGDPEFDARVVSRVCAYTEPLRAETPEAPQPTKGTRTSGA